MRVDIHLCQRTLRHCRNVIFYLLSNGWPKGPLTINGMMKKLSGIVILLFIVTAGSTGQQYYSKTGKVTFVSDAPLEKIEAHNNNGYVVFDAATGNIEWSVLIKGFQFVKALMQDHFN